MMGLAWRAVAACGKLIDCLLFGRIFGNKTNLINQLEMC
jgi:hypothetical protein